ncbi:MAG TPA: DNA-binding response regulator [Erysipelotrichaceae bacterium]|nr:DNA-binding response regulator [Erysipelotrichaceae bacterium]
MRILLAEDEHDLKRALVAVLTHSGYDVDAVENGAEAVRLASMNAYDCMVLDIMMPVMDGVTALAKIREFSNVPVIMLTARSEGTDKILGLNLGADDYVTKPFNPVELMARVRSGLRRYMLLGGNGKLQNSSSEMFCGGIRLLDDSKEVFLDGDPLKLTRTEYDILKFLMQNPGKVYTPKEIYKEVWNDDMMGTESIVAVHIRHLREKIEIDPSSPRYIKMIWGRGYYLERQQG